MDDNFFFIGRGTHSRINRERVVSRLQKSLEVLLRDLKLFLELTPF